MFTTLRARFCAYIASERIYLVLGIICLLGSVALTANAVLVTVSDSGLFGDADVIVDGAGALNLGTSSSTAVTIGKTGMPVTVPGSMTVVGSLTLGSASTTGQLLFKNASTSFTTLLQASSSQASNLTFTLPNATGTPGQAMLTDGAGNLYFDSIGSSQWLNGTSGTISYSSGSIGINTTTPLALLSIAGISSSTVPLFNVVNSTGVSLFRITPDGTVAVGTTLLAKQTATVACGVSTPCSNSGGTAYTDHVAINAALTAASAAGGGKVVLGSGDYYVGAAISVPTLVDFSGQGVGITRIHLRPATQANVVETSGGTNVSIHDMSLDGGGPDHQSAAPSLDVVGNGLSFVNVTQFHAYNLETYGAFFHGIMGLNGGGSSAFQIDHIWTHDNGFRGMHIHADNSSAINDYLVSYLQSWHNGRCWSGDLNCPSLVSTSSSGVFLALENTSRAVLSNIESWNEPFSCLSIHGAGNGLNLPAHNILLVDSTAHNCNTAGIGHGGVDILSGSTQLTLSNVISVNNSGPGISFDSGTSYPVTTTPTNGSRILTSVSNTAAIYPGATLSGTNIPVGAKVVSVTGSTITMSAVATGSPGAETVTVGSSIYNVSILGGQYNGNGGNSISLGGGPIAAITISGVQISGNTGVGIYWGGVATELNITNNSILDNGGYGIIGDGTNSVVSSGVSISDNTISRNSGGGVYVAHCEDCIIGRNQLFDNSAGGSQYVMRFIGMVRSRVFENVGGYRLRTPGTYLYNAVDATYVNLSFTNNICVNPGSQHCIVLGGNGGLVTGNTSNGTGNIVYASVTSSNLILEANYNLPVSGTPNETMVNLGTNNKVRLVGF